MTEGKMLFKRVDAGCTANDYHATFISTDELVIVTIEWSPEKSYYIVYPVIAECDFSSWWASPSICITREFEGIKTPMELEALVTDRMNGASIIGDEHDFTINWNGVPAFKVQTPGHKSVHMITTVYKDALRKEFVLDTRSIKCSDNHTGTIVDYNPRNLSHLTDIMASGATFINATVVTSCNKDTIDTK